MDHTHPAQGATKIDRRHVLAFGAAAACQAGLGGPAYALETALDGAAIHWVSRGRGPRTLIFVHGWTGDTSIWAEQVKAFSGRYRVITLDLPGHGASAQPAGGAYSIPMFARAVDAVRAAAGVHRAVVIGHSMGGLIVRQYALMYPNRVEALVLADGLMRGPPSGARPATRVLSGGEGRRNLERMIDGMFVKTTPPTVRDKVLKVSLTTPEATVVGAMAATRAAPWAPTPVGVPVLGLYAEHSRLSNPAVIRRIFPTMQYHELEGTGHFLMMERPQAFDAMLESFLATLPPPGATRGS